MKIVSYNVNGIRAAMNKGFVDWLKQVNPDVVGLQEVKANLEQIDATIFEDLGYEIFWHSAVKKGYSGVAILTKIKPKSVKYGMEYLKYDDEGRILQVDFDDFSFLTAYFPSGTTGEARQGFKYEFLDDIYGYSQDLRRTNTNLILSGDYNICHKAIDIHNPKSNKNCSGFLPEERAWMDKFTESGFVDSFRKFNSAPDNYTWWSYRANSRAKNLGWRIDYHMATAPMEERLKSSIILADTIHSDHCPILIEVE
ncbi:exodeoxyribonuclease-3 [Algoriphagus ratkowskyi]|uniref:Exodeoxyribonuclease III n=1 Tax=Algoriphagus ratkowskyi TaxID=57028 RepID=A0A2W7T592_9BACT|nr:exodeoxyribonuclease III [Algoriphagus ratkowskyi]PZX58352.1 exodeoxyribonuclease-3 [Algoriphagus ratkowskyi]TXD77778.1 exodeoxyribonuclease III [Algoriphagus ratkowskyi]